MNPRFDRFHLRQLDQAPSCADTRAVMAGSFAVLTRERGLTGGELQAVAFVLCTDDKQRLDVHEPRRIEPAVEKFLLLRYQVIAYFGSFKHKCGVIQIFMICRRCFAASTCIPARVGEA